MKRAYVSWGSTTSGKKNETRSQKKRSQNSGETKVFRLGPQAKKTRLQKTYGFPKTFKTHGKMKVCGLQRRQRAGAIHGGFKRAMRNCTGIPLKTLGFLVFPGGPRRGNDVNPKLPVAIHGNSYGFLNLGNPWKELCSQHAEPAARSGDPRRLPVCNEKMRWDPTKIRWDSLCLVVVPGIW